MVGITNIELHWWIQGAARAWVLFLKETLWPQSKNGDTLFCCHFPSHTHSHTSFKRFVKPSTRQPPIQEAAITEAQQGAAYITQSAAWMQNPFRKQCPVRIYGPIYWVSLTQSALIHSVKDHCSWLWPDPQRLTQAEFVPCSISFRAHWSATVFWFQQWECLDKGHLWAQGAELE